LNYYRPLGNPTKFISELIRHFSRLKDENISAAEYLKYAEDLESDQDQRLGGNKLIKKAKVLPEKLRAKATPKIAKTKIAQEISGRDEEELEIGRIRELANAYHVYNQLLLQNNFWILAIYWFIL